MFLEKVKKSLKRYKMLELNDRVFVGVSGGPDSVALVHALYRLRKELGIEIYIGHLSHMLQPEFSRKSEAFVKDIARELGLPFISKEINVPEYMERRKLSPEEAAREVRYQFFTEEAGKCNANKIATGHTKDDQAETILLRIIKGSGSRGMRGILPVRDNKFIRPLIDLRREEIEDFLKKESIGYLHDPSNTEPIYLRNKIRLELIPKLKKEYNPNIVEALTHLSHVIGEEESFLEEMARDAFEKILFKKEENRLEIDLSSFQTLALSLQRRIIREGTEVFNIRGISFKHISDILELINKKVSGKSLNLPEGLIIYKEYNRLIFTKNRESHSSLFNYHIRVPTNITIDTGVSSYSIDCRVKSIKESVIDFHDKDDYTAFLDFDKAGEDLVIRNRRPGDRFHPLGLNGTKKLKKYFIDEKIPRSDRNIIPLIAKDHEILWVVGKGISEDVKLSNESKRVLIIEVSKT